MFLPKGFTDAVNGSVIFPVARDGNDLLPRFRRKAHTLPETAPNGVLRYSVTGKGTRPRNPKGRGVLGNVGLALIEAEARKVERAKAKTLKAFSKIAGAR